MEMKVLITGAFGNIGESTLLAMREKGYDLVCFDLENNRTKKKAEELKEKVDFDVVWGDITNKTQIVSIADRVDAIIHLAAIIPPLSEQNPKLARKVNVGGTRNLVEVADGLENKPKFILASSVSTYGPRGPDKPLVTADTPQKPTDHYTHHKVECEKILKESSLPWTILRLTAIPPLELGTDMDPLMFEIPLDQPMEFAHTSDVGVAFTNCVEADTIGYILLIGGGPECQMYNREFMNKMMDVMGIGTLPEDAFKEPATDDDWYYTSWMDTSKSQELLHYQSRTFDDYLEQLKDKVGFKRHIMKLFSPLIRRIILKNSPYLNE